MPTALKKAFLLISSIFFSLLGFGSLYLMLFDGSEDWGFDMKTVFVLLVILGLFFSPAIWSGYAFVQLHKGKKQLTNKKLNKFVVISGVVALLVVALMIFLLWAIAQHGSVAP